MDDRVGLAAGEPIPATAIIVVIGDRAFGTINGESFGAARINTWSPAAPGGRVVDDLRTLDVCYDARRARLRAFASSFQEMSQQDCAGWKLLPRAVARFLRSGLRAYDSSHLVASVSWAG